MLSGSILFNDEDPKKQTKNTNFALLVAKHFSEPFKDSNGYGESIARLSNMLGGGVIVQRFGDLVRGRRRNAARIKEGYVKLKWAINSDNYQAKEDVYQTITIEDAQISESSSNGWYSLDNRPVLSAPSFAEISEDMTSWKPSIVPNIAEGENSSVTYYLMQNNPYYVSNLLTITGVNYDATPPAISAKYLFNSIASLIVSAACCFCNLVELLIICAICWTVTSGVGS